MGLSLMAMVAAIVLACNAWVAAAWLQQTTPRPPSCRLANMASSEEDGETKFEIVAEAPKAVYGVSYIGGDPCGSKYNDDPFDTQVQKPGMPDDMKARIQALVDKKVVEEKQQAKQKQEEIE